MEARKASRSWSRHKQRGNQHEESDDPMSAQFSVANALKTTWNRIQADTKLLLLLGFIVLLVGGLTWEEDTCGAERVVLTAIYLDNFEKTSISDAEKQETATVIVDGTQTAVPFGHINHEWENLKRQYEKGDCIYHYRTDCGPLCGSEGYLLIRNGNVIDWVLTLIS